MKTKTALLAIAMILATPLWAKTRILSDYQIRNMAEVIVTKVNERGDWLVVSSEGAFYNGRKVLFDYQIGEEGQLVADLNNAGDWIVVSRKGAFVNGSTVVISGNIASNSALAADINDKGDWVVASSMGAYKGKANE